ncbi:unnamed protein product [marine sediment metagenome]|uniref:Uncharacterized protein n=1 Tax=marine sediment metagenome TaxID=412755 RepID=X1KAP4_9ZZZZ
MTQLADEEKQPIYGVEYADVGLMEFVPKNALSLEKIQAECRGIRIIDFDVAVKMSQFHKGDPWNYYEVEIPEDFSLSMSEIADAFSGIENRVFTLRKFVLA